MASNAHEKQNMTHLFSLHSVQAKNNLSTKLKIREPFPRKGPLSYLAALIMRKLSQGILQLVGYVKKVTQYIYQATPHQFRHHAFHGIGWGEQGGSKFPTSCTLYVQFPLPSLVVPASVYFFFAKNCAMLQNLFSISPGTCLRGILSPALSSPASLKADLHGTIFTYDCRCSRHGKIVYDFHDIKLPVATIVVRF